MHGHKRKGLIGGAVPQVCEAAYFSKVFVALQTRMAKGEVMAGHDIGAGGLITTLFEMCFGSENVGMSLQMDELMQDFSSSLIEVLFSESPGIVLQGKKGMGDALAQEGVRGYVLGSLSFGKEACLQLHGDKRAWKMKVNTYKKHWYTPALRLNMRQMPSDLAQAQAQNAPLQPLRFDFPSSFPRTHSPRGTQEIVAAVVREKGSNSECEMAYALHRVGFRVRDVHMSDIMEGREDLQDVRMLAFVGGFSHADVLGAGRGWAAMFQHCARASAILKQFYRRKDVLSLGVCNGCQLMGELSLLSPTHFHLQENASKRFECHFVSVRIAPSACVMLKPLEGAILGVWAAHGEGRFELPAKEKACIPLRYLYADYPGNPNGSPEAMAGICSPDGRHLAMMPHMERSLFPSNWAYYPYERKKEEETPWMLSFLAAYHWLENNT